MAIFGYLVASPALKNTDSYRQRLMSVGCDSLYEERGEDERLRPVWKLLIEQIPNQSTLVVPRLSMIIRDSSHLTAFFQWVELKNIRIIAFDDKFDTDDKAYPARSSKEMVNYLVSIPKDALQMRAEIKRGMKPKALRRFKATGAKNKPERNAAIVNLYQSGMPISAIQKVSGFRSRSSLYRVLDDAGVAYNRGHSKQERQQKQ